MIGEINSIIDDTIIVYPLIIGAPTYDHWENDESKYDFLWDGQKHYELYPDDIDLFSNIKDVELEDNEWQEYMKDAPEKHIKESIAKLLCDETEKDWGGEMYDHFTSDIQVGSKRMTAAFVYKGKASWHEMKLKDLGKNGDQIYRLSQSDADILIVQHCHNIGEPVRATLRAFAVQPHRPRHYCIIDGKDTYKILKANNLLTIT